jgi:hypothetical protein
MSNISNSIVNNYKKIHEVSLGTDEFERASKLQAAELSAKSIVANVTDDWMPVSMIPGVEMKRSSAKVAVNNSVVVKGLGHAWSHGIKVVDENGVPIGSINDLKSPWGRFVAKFVPELDAEANNKDVDQGIGGEEEEGMVPGMIDPEQQQKEEEQQTISEVKSVICQSVEHINSILHRLKLKQKEYISKKWSSNTPLEERGIGYEYDFNHISKQICSDIPEALSVRFRNLKSFTAKGNIKMLKEDFNVPPKEALLYATNYLNLMETTKVSGYLDNENSILEMAEKFSIVDGGSPEKSYVIFNGDDGISGAAISQEASPILFDIVSLISDEIKEKYVEDNIIVGIPKVKEDNISYRFKTLGLDVEKFSRLLALMAHSGRNPNLNNYITTTLLEIVNSAGGEIITGLNNIVRYSLTDIDKMANTDLAYQLRDSFGFIDGMDSEKLKEFMLKADSSVGIKWSAEQAKSWIKSMLHSVVTINQKSNMMRRPIGVAETGTEIYLGSKSDVIEYFPPNVGETILLNQGVPPEKIRDLVKLKQETGRVGNEKAGTAMNTSEMFGLAKGGYDSVNFSLKSLFSPKEMNIHLGGYKYTTVLNALETVKGPKNKPDPADRAAMAMTALVENYSKGIGVKPSYVKTVLEDTHKRISDMNKLFSVGLGKFMDKKGIDLSKEQKGYVMGLIDDLIDRNIFESSVSYRLRQIKTDPSKELSSKEISEVAGALLVQKLKYDMFKPNKTHLGLATDQDVRNHQKKCLHSIGLLMHMNGGCSESTLMQVTDVPNNDVYLVEQNQIIHDALNALSQAIDAGEDIEYKPGKNTISGYSLEFTKESKINIKGPHIAAKGDTSFNRPLNYVSLYYKTGNFKNMGDTLTSLTFEVDTNRRYVASKSYYAQQLDQSGMVTENLIEILSKQNENISRLLLTLSEKNIIGKK